MLPLVQRTTTCPSRLRRCESSVRNHLVVNDGHATMREHPMERLSRLKHDPFEEEEARD